MKCTRIPVKKAYYTLTPMTRRGDEQIKKGVRHLGQRSTSNIWYGWA